jgi:hypothetical protein
MIGIQLNGESDGGGHLTSTPTSTPTLTPTPRDTLLSAVVAAPNISRDGEPIRFLFNLQKPVALTLSLYSVTGEEAYQTKVFGNTGSNSLVWNLDNQAGESVASGLYIFVLRADNGTGMTTKVGRVVVLH